VDLDGSGSSDVDGDPLTYKWSFTSLPLGSAAVLSDATAVNPSFVVDLFGDYVVQLIVNDGTVNSAPDTITISTLNSAPVADAGPDQTVFVGYTVNLDGSGSSDVDGDPLTYQWSFTSLPPGSTAVLSDTTAMNPSFVADRRGIYVVQLIVNDGTVNSAPDTVTIDAESSSPLADAGPDQTVLEGTEVTLNGSGSIDPDNNIIAFHWYEGSTILGSGAILKHTFPLGSHNIKLDVIDSFGQMDTDEVIVNVVTEFRQYLTEHFTGVLDPFDLSFKSIMFTPAADGGSYTACIRQISQLPTSPAGGIELALDDDSFEFVGLGDQKSVSIFGSSFTGFYVGSNGYIVFSEGDEELFESLSSHFDTKRISVLFSDLDPSAGGMVSFLQLPDRVAVTWENIPEYGSTNSNTFQVEMYFDGRIQLSWLGVDASEGLVGLSQGLGVPIDYQDTDFSESPQCN
jgi:hypothetical protein